MSRFSLAVRFLALLLIGLNWSAGALAQKAALVRDADQPARAPFHAQCSIDTFDAATGSPSCSLGVAPAGSMLVIETVTASIGIVSGAIIRDIRIFAGRPLHLAASPTPLSTQGTFQTYTVSQPMRVYVQPGIPMTASVTSANGIETFSTFVIHGYLVSLP